MSIINRKKNKFFKTTSYYSILSVLLFLLQLSFIQNSLAVPQLGLMDSSSSNEEQQEIFKKMVVKEINEKNCSKRMINNLVVLLMEEFQKEFSLLNLKKKILKEDLMSKYFITSYKIEFNPLYQKIILNFECPFPIASLQIYQDKFEDKEQFLLTDNNVLFDSTFELILREEKRLNDFLPSIYIESKLWSKQLQNEIFNFIKQFKYELREYLSDFIINQENGLTIILSLNGNPLPIFFGQENWNEKFSKFKKIFEHLERKRRIPLSINISNLKKIVVKF